MQKIGKKLRILRNLHDYTQESVAFQLGISQKTYSRLEKDESPLDTALIDCVAQLYKISKLVLFRFFETDEKVFIQKIAETNGVYNANGSVVQHQGFTEAERSVLFEQIKQQQQVIQHLMSELNKLQRN
ncbi:MAG: helix-turn-helix transcriptional regulator [Microscillaceae bacterium]|nr:helix-turn-helix transcriptional regulator [Microscillaceae bacterium]